MSLPDTNRYEICPGDSIQLNGQWIYDTLKIESHYQNQNGCDSVHRTIVSYKSIPQEKNLQYFICQGDSIYIANAWIKEEMNWTIRKQNQSSCDSVFHYQIKWYDEIHVDVLNELQIDEGDSLVLDPYYSSNVNQVNWSPSTGLSCTNCLRPKVSPPKDTKYYITVQDDNGCTAIDSILIRLIKKEKELYVPNSFSPNGDNLNDRWGPVLEEGNGMVESIKVFDRWGNLVYECSGLQIKNGLCAKWDGSLR
ncbi:MAG: gliding motility-associated C-terminal domain-containing protein [Saprospiraceae bacterium]|nr:gliding motility-associated C-terminal domain-containing protein [Saprospiraceae bacterium]